MSDNPDRSGLFRPCQHRLPILVIKVRREYEDKDADITEETRNQLEKFCKGMTTSVTRQNGETVEVSLKLVALDFQHSGISPPCKRCHFDLPCIFIVALSESKKYLRLMHACPCLYECRISDSCKPRHGNGRWNENGQIELELAQSAFLSSGWNVDELQGAMNKLGRKHKCISSKVAARHLLRYHEADNLLICECGRRKKDSKLFFSEKFFEIQPSWGEPESFKTSPVRKTPASSKKKQRSAAEDSISSGKRSKVASDLELMPKRLPSLAEFTSKSASMVRLESMAAMPMPSNQAILTNASFQCDGLVESVASVTARTGTVSTTNQSTLSNSNRRKDKKLPSMLSPEAKADLVTRAKKVRGHLAKMKEGAIEIATSARLTLEDGDIARECEVQLSQLAKLQWMQVMGQGGGMQLLNYVRTTAILRDEGGTNDRNVGGSNLLVFLSLLLFAHCKHPCMKSACVEWKKQQIKRDSSDNRGGFLKDYGFPLPSRYRRLIVRFEDAFDEYAAGAFGLQVNQSDVQYHQSLDELRHAILRAESGSDSGKTATNNFDDVQDVDLDESKAGIVENEVDYVIVIPGWLIFEFVSYGNQASLEMVEEAVRQAHYLFQLRNPNSGSRELNPDPFLKAAIIIMNQTNEGTEEELDLARSELHSEMRKAAQKKMNDNRLNGARHWNSLNWLETNLQIFSFDVHSSLDSILFNPDRPEGDLAKIDDLLCRVSRRVVDRDAPIFIIAEDLLQGAVSLLELDHENDSKFLEDFTSARHHAVLQGLRAYSNILSRVRQQQREILERDYQLSRTEANEAYKSSLMLSLSAAGYKFDEDNAFYIQAGVEDLIAINQGIGKLENGEDILDVIGSVASHESQDDRWEDKWNACEKLLNLMQLLWPEHF